jgi:hypothetical protein
MAKAEAVPQSSSALIHIRVFGNTNVESCWTGG